MILGYIRVSTVKQELENQKNALYEFARSRKFIIDKFLETEISSHQHQSKRKLDEIFNLLKKGDMLLITELSRLGRSLSEILNIVNKLIKHGIELLTVKENIHIQGKHSMQSKVMISMFALFAELERDLISVRTKEALSIKKAQGVRLGRPKGAGKSKLDKHQTQIQELLDKKVSMLSISKILNVSYPTLFNFIKVRNMRSKIIKKIAKDAIKTMKVRLALIVENNNKFVRGKKKTIESIELSVIPSYDHHYKNLGDNEYELTLSYKTSKELDKIVYDLLEEISRTADYRHCHTEETFVESLDVEDKFWP